MEIAEVLHKIGYTNLRDFGTHYRTAPLYRPSDNPTSLSIKKQTGEFYDFATKHGGNLYRLIQLTLHLSSIEEAKKYAEGAVIPVGISRFSDNHNELKEAARWPKAMLQKLLGRHDYWLRRNISIQTLELFGGGLAVNGRLAGRYVFPIFNQKDELVGFAGRITYDNPNVPKWKLIGAKNEWIYPIKLNLAEIMAKKEVILVESIGDMLTLWECGIKNVLVTFGVEVSGKLVQFLLKADVQNIVLALNNDPHLIGNKAAVEASIELSKYFDARQIRVCLPTLNDFGVMTKEEIELWKTTCLSKKD